MGSSTAGVTKNFHAAVGVRDAANGADAVLRGAAVAQTKPKSKKRSGGVALSVDSAIARAIGLQQAGNDAEAAALYRNVLARQPAHLDAMHFLGVAEHRLGRSAAGLEWIEKALRRVEDHPDLHNNHGNVLKALGRLDEAEAAYERALALRPLDPAALSNLGAVARERGQYARAETLLQDAIAIAPQHYEAHQHLASVYKRTARLSEALLAQQQALSLRPTFADALFKLGATYYALGRVGEAADVYRRWIEADPEHPVPRHLLAGCTGQGVPARASDDFVRASFDAFARHFDRSLAKLEYRAPELVASAVCSALGTPRATLDVLDAGVGTGLCGADLRPFAQRLVGVDLSAAMLEHARERGSYDELVVMELGAYLEQAHASYDLIVCADTLVYFGALEPVLSGFASALRSTGTLVLTTEHCTDPDLPDGFRIHAHGRYSHVEAYVRRALAAAGLALAQLQHVELRREAGKWVAGLLVTARKPA